MANTISNYCVVYVNSQEEKLRMYNTYLLTKDLTKPLISHTGSTVSYDKLTVSGSMGTYSRASGYSAKDITMARATHNLTQDKGDKLTLDLMDRNEAQIEGGIIRLYNNYVIKVEIPEVDKYRFKAIATTTSIPTSYKGSLTSANVVSKLFEDKKTLGNKRVRWEECIVYMGETAKALLDEAAFGKGIISVGNWNGQLDTTVEMFKGAKIIAVPDDTLGKVGASGAEQQIDWIVTHPLAVDAFVVHQEAVFFDKVPGYGGRLAEVDVGIYHDCFVNDNCLDGVVVAVEGSAPQLGG